MKTAVEWLEDNLIFVAWAEEHFIHNKKCLEQAKAMEKDQMMQCYEDGYNRMVKLIEDATQKNLNL